jgi:hypothetical protein
MKTIAICSISASLIMLSAPIALAGAETAARLHRWEFLYMMAPLPVTGGTGSPVNSLAVF